MEWLWIASQLLLALVFFCVVFGGLVFLPIAHWRRLSDSEFPLGGLTRDQWKIAWLVTLFCGVIFVLGAVYWWLWRSRLNEKRMAHAHDSTLS